MRILLVDDDAALMETLGESLIRQRYAIDIAEDGATAQEFLSLFSYDILVLDMLLPDVDGISFCRQCRQQGTTTPILMLTAEASHSDKVKALDAGADDYVVKPFDFEELCARIRALLRRDSPQVTTALNWGLLRVNPTTFEVVYGDHALRTTPKEYALLELFLRHPDRVFSLDTIIDNLWAFDDPPSGDAVRTHIKGLRQKLKAGGAPKDFIETVYGLGYRLNPIEGQVSALEARSPSSNPLPSLAPSSSSQADFATAVAKAWITHQSTMEERLKVLETAVSALHEGSLTVDLQHAAQAQSHKLAGSLGCFGFAEGSRLARELERLLQSSRLLSPAQLSEFNYLVDQLRQNLAEGMASPWKAPTIASPAQLLVMATDTALPTALANAGLRFMVASNPFEAEAILHSHQESIDGALLWITSANYDAALTLLAAIAQRTHPIPVLIVSDLLSVDQRLTMVRGGGDRFLAASVAVSQVVETMQQLLYTTKAAIKIVLMDDDEQILALLRTILAPWGWHLTTVIDPAELWSVLETVQPHLLVLDVEMPGTSGLDLCQVLRADEQWRQLPIIFLTAHEEAGLQRHAFAVGGDDFISKATLSTDLPPRILNRLKRSLV